jgi:hypothetical protein
MPATSMRWVCCCWGGMRAALKTRPGRVSQTVVQASAAAIVRTGLADVGYNYVVSRVASRKKLAGIIDSC